MKLKNIIAVLLILLSLAGIFVWESYGREKLTMQEVLVLSSDLKAGEKLGTDKLSVIYLPRESVMSGGLCPNDSGRIAGKIAKLDLYANQQLSEAYFTDESSLLKYGESIFALPQAWIYSRPSLLRAGDRVSIYTMPEKAYMGTYTIAYVRDAQEQSVKDADGSGENIYSRDNSTGVISNLEIVAKKEEYFRIYDSAVFSDEASLLVVLEAD